MKKKNKSSGAKREPGLFRRLEALYRRMELAYASCAEEAGLSCADCPTNCCTSFFQHHTYVEWSYLWRGLLELPDHRRREIVRLAEDYMGEAGSALALNAVPKAMCPLNSDSLCTLYSYRMMICRMHGTRNVLTMPDGRRRFFPGCARFVSLPCTADPSFSNRQEGGRVVSRDTPDDACPSLDRTPFYAELAALEREFLTRAASPLTRVNLTLAEMILLGPPALR
ncbi:MAG: hypothetical protein LBD42_03520 [Desulfovibrio sp.]|jgi:hypothetical protein|nr:hypothetical protein [Desulfovibrio sp.]